MKFNRTGYTDDDLRALYESILYPRLIEEKMLILLRQGRISKWFSGIGQEAIAVGATQALQKDDWILPLHRNLGVWTTRKIPFVKLFSQWQGKKTGFTKGRDRSFHFGTPEYKIIGMISHLGAMLPVADGLALASNLNGEDQIAMVFSGDGGASEGDFHEAINLATVWDLPVIFLVENNGYGLSTPSREQFRHKQFIDKAIGYGIEGIQVDGNNVLEVNRAVRQIAEKMRKDRRPVLLECMTFRMRGHEEASGTKYVPQELFDEWGKKDPITNFENFLVKIGVYDTDEIEAIRKDIKKQINDDLKAAENEPDVTPDLEEELNDVFAPTPALTHPAPAPGDRELRLVDACKEGLEQAMEANDQLIVMGQDIADYGGVFKVTDGFLEKFGKDRVRNTPISESAPLGASLGLSLRNRPSVVEMQFSDFVSCGFNQIVNNLAKTHYRWALPIQVTVRMPTGGGVAAGPYHSQSTEAWFGKTAGLKVVYPSNPYDAKGLLTASISDPNPVLFFEHKYLYRTVSGPVPEAYYQIPLGKAAIPQAGNDLTIVTYGWGVHWALEIANEIGNESIEVVDLRTLVPWDQETVFASVRKTGKVLVLNEDTARLSFSAEIASVIAEELFEFLDGPVKRIGSLDTPVPFNAKLENQFLGKARLKEAVESLLAY